MEKEPSANHTTVEEALQIKVELFIKDRQKVAAQSSKINSKCNSSAFYTIDLTSSPKKGKEEGEKE